MSRRPSVFRTFGPLLLVQAAALVGCNAYDEGLINKLPTGPVGCTPGETGCLPTRPGGAPQEGTLELTFALRDILLNQKNSMVPDLDPSQPWRGIGFDLDTYDTIPPNGASSCLTPSSGFPPVDGINGIDNVFGSLLGPALVTRELESDICCFQGHGVGTLLLHVTGWNGTRNDNKVEVSLLLSSAGTSTPVGDVQWNSTLRGPELTATPGTAAAFPAWTPGTDTFFIGSDEITAGDVDNGKHLDRNAFIVDGTIVMTLSSTRPVRLYLGNENSIKINLIDGHLTARMSPFTEADAAGSGLVPPAQIDVGVMGGRMGASGISDATLSLFGAGLVSQEDCAGALSTTGLVIDQGADVLSDPTQDLADGDPECDAVSVGVSFHAVRVAGITAAGSAGNPIFFEPSCDATNVVMPDAPIPFLNNVCSYGYGIGCDLPAFVPTPVTDGGVP